MTEGRFAHLYQTYGPAIYARCRRLLGDGAAAEDATQETFLRVHRALDRVPNGDEAFYWIYRITTNLCLNQLRDRRREASPEPEQDRPAPGRSLEDLLADRDLAARIIARMPERYGAPAWLHYVDGLDQGEVAQVLGVSRRTVINRLAAFQTNALKFVQRGHG